MASFNGTGTPQSKSLVIALSLSPSEIHPREKFLALSGQCSCFEIHELLDSYCAICEGSPKQKKTEHWFFKLSEFSPKLKEWISKQEHWPDNARNFS
ncbi:MAG: class I tRNA ligase family protein, partial [Candidatus Altiarchaeota archaeon]|nr:class I tRNA ligase family protein [Candidatus Altiarchaeota archaeon]